MWQMGEVFNLGHACAINLDHPVTPNSYEYWEATIKMVWDFQENLYHFGGSG